MYHVSQFKVYGQSSSKSHLYFIRHTYLIAKFNGDIERLKAVLRASIASTRPRPCPLSLPCPLLAGRPGPGPPTSHDTPWSLTFLLKAERDGDSEDSGDSGVGGGGVIQTSTLGFFAGIAEETSGDSGVGGGGVIQTSTLDLFAGVDGETSEEVLQVLF